MEPLIFEGSMSALREFASGALIDGEEYEVLRSIESVTSLIRRSDRIEMGDVRVGEAMLSPATIDNPYQDAPDRGCPDFNNSSKSSAGSGLEK